MTTVRPALDAALRHTIALRTEALFRSSGAFREGHFLLKSGRHGDAYVEKFQVLQDPAATSELCGFFAEHGRGPRWRDARRPRRRADDRRDHPRLRDGAPARGPQHLRRGGPRRRRHDPPRVPARVPDRARRAGPARRRHPDDRRLAAGDDPRGRGDGWRDRRVRRARRPERRPDDPHLADDRRVYPLRSLWQLDLPTYEPGPGDLPALRRRDAAPCARAAPGRARSRDRRGRALNARADPATESWIAAPGTCSRSPSSWSSRVTGAAAFLLGGSSLIDPGAPPDATAVDGVIVARPIGGSRPGQRLRPPDDDQGDARVHDRRPRERRRVPAGPPRRAPGDGAAGPGLVPDRGRRQGRDPARGRPELTGGQPPAVMTGRIASSSASE